jgi:hypothetical protein
MSIRSPWSGNSQPNQRRCSHCQCAQFWPISYQPWHSKSLANVPVTVKHEAAGGIRLCLDRRNSSQMTPLPTTVLDTMAYNHVR